MPHETIAVLLGSTMGTDEWEISPPLDVPAQALITKFVRTPEFGFRDHDDNGNPIPYRLLWQQANRYLGESETLRAAGVAEGHKLLMTFEARAGW